MSDPVDIVADALARYWPELKDRGQRQWIAGDVLRPLVEDGWRIVRTESVEASTDDGPEWLSRVVEEWTPNENEEGQP